MLILQKLKKIENKVFCQSTLAQFFLLDFSPTNTSREESVYPKTKAKKNQWSNSDWK